MIFQGRGRPQGNIVEKEIRLFPKKGRPQGNIVEMEIRVFSKKTVRRATVEKEIRWFPQKSCKTKKPVFWAAQIQYAHIKNQFNSFNTDQPSIKQNKKVPFSSKKLSSLRISRVLLGDP